MRLFCHIGGLQKTDVFIAEQASSSPGGHVGVYVSEPNMRRLKWFMEGHTFRPSGRCRDGSIVLPPTDLGCDPKAIDSSSRKLIRDLGDGAVSNAKSGDV